MVRVTVKPSAAYQVAPLVAPLSLVSKIDICSELVGMAGFEPAASCSQSRRANQAAPHPADRSVAYRPACCCPARLPWPWSAQCHVSRPVASRGFVSALGNRAGTLSVLTWRNLVSTPTVRA